MGHPVDTFMKYSLHFETSKQTCIVCYFEMFFICKTASYFTYQVIAIENLFLTQYFKVIRQA